MDPLVARVIKEFVCECPTELGRLAPSRRQYLSRMWPELHKALDNLSWDHTEVSIDAYVVVDSAISSRGGDSTPAS